MDANQHTETRQLNIDDESNSNYNDSTRVTNIANIAVTGVPDGVSPLANQALIPTGTIRRLYVFSDAELDTKHLEMIDTFYGKQPYPNFKCDILRKASTLSVYPKHNFYMRNNADAELTGLLYNNTMDSGCPTMSCSYIEYRYLQQRHMLANIYFNPYTGSVFRLVLPTRPLLCIIMPQNFIRTGPKQGYFRFENNLIVRVYSRYLLSSEHEDNTTINNDSNNINDTKTFYDLQDAIANDNASAPESLVTATQQQHEMYLNQQQQPIEVTVFDVNNVKLQRMVRQLFGRFGLHKIDSFSSNHMFAYDKYITMIVGSVANIELPNDYNEHNQYTYYDDTAINKNRQYQQSLLIPQSASASTTKLSDSFSPEKFNTKSNRKIENLINSVMYEMATDSETDVQSLKMK